MAITMCLSLFFAAVLTQTKFKEKNLYRVIFFFPNVLSIVIIGVLFSHIYEPNTGILNVLLKGIGLENCAKPWCGKLSGIIWSCIWQAC
ncbi:MAG: hypothetical protein RR090_11235 [Niameybacter sp.]